MSPSYKLILQELQKLENINQEINDKLDKLLTLHNNPNLQINLDFLALPKHLQTTALALQSIGKGTATDISQRTGKVREIESHYLNQLVSMGKVSKIRENKKVVFQLRSCL